MTVTRIVLLLELVISVAIYLIFHAQPFTAGCAILALIFVLAYLILGTQSLLGYMTKRMAPWWERRLEKEYEEESVWIDIESEALRRAEGVIIIIKNLLAYSSAILIIVALFSIFPSLCFPTPQDP